MVFDLVCARARNVLIFGAYTGTVCAHCVIFWSVHVIFFLIFFIFLVLESVRSVHIVCDRLKNVCFVKVSLGVCVQGV